MRIETETAASRTQRLWDGTVEGTARLLLKELLNADQTEAIAILLPWISDRVRATMRRAIREAEAEIFGEKDGRKATAYRNQTGPLPAISNLERLLALPVAVPGKGYVVWKDMTVKDHEARVSALERTVNGTRATIRKHEWSIREIMGFTGATCLGDIPIDKIGKDIP